MKYRDIVTMAVIYTLLMMVAVEIVAAPRFGIVFAVANAWFWIGRLSAGKVGQVRQ